VKRALVIRHAAAESLVQNDRRMLESHGFCLEPLNIFEHAPAYDRFCPPDLADISLVLVLGGPMSANDDYLALHEERAYIKAAMAEQKPVSGICLGAQLMATALGGAVQPTGGFQFGLRKIFVNADGDSDPVFSKITVPLVPTLHGDCFTIPPGAVSLAEGFMPCLDVRDIEVLDKEHLTRIRVAANRIRLRKALGRVIWEIPVNVLQNGQER